MTKLLSSTGTSPVTWKRGTLTRVRGGLAGGAALALHDAEQGDQADRVGVDAGGDGAVGGERALGEAGRARGEEDGGVVLGQRPRAGRASPPRRAGAPAPRRSASRPAGRRWRMPRPVASSRFARGASQITRQGSVSARPWRSSSACHQPLTRVAIAARLQHRHVGDDPGRAVAHRDRDPVALADAPAAGQRPRQPRSQRRSVRAKVSRSPSAMTAIGVGVERAEGVEQAGQGRRQVGDDRCAPPRPRPIWMRPPGPGHLRQHRVELAVQLARHPTLPFPFPALPPNREAAAGGSL